MTDNDLPEDMQAWPREAHELLGIERFSDERSLKRAYTRLIRRFKPDHHPQQFARIRGAYEELQQLLQWRAQFDSPPTEQIISLDQILNSPPPTDRVTTSDLPQLPVSEPDDVSQPPVTIAENVAANSFEPRHEFGNDLDGAWKHACRGDAAAGYRQLVQLHEQDRGNEEFCLRLYWLLRFYPELDRERDPTDWLVGAMRRQPSERAWVLYRSELKRRPGLVLSTGNDQLRSTPATPQQLFEFLSVRWRAAADLEHWDLIQSDLHSFKPLLILDSTTIWARMLFLVADLAIWSNNQEARELKKLTYAELNSLTELQLELINEFERYDLLLELSRTLVELPRKPLPPEIVAVLRASWLDSYYELRPMLQILLDEWVERPGAALRGLDALRKNYPPAFHLLRTTIFSRDLSESVRENPEHQLELRHLIVDFFVTYSNFGYHSLRIRLLAFCVEHHLTLSVIQAVFENPPMRLKSQVTLENITEDVPLAVVLAGIAAYWS